MSIQGGAIQKVLVTGAAGFIGFHLCEALLKSNIPVLGIDNFLTGTHRNASDLIQRYPHLFHFVEADISRPWDWRTTLHDRTFTHIFHLASPACPQQYQRFPLETMMCNSIGLQNALNFAEECQARLIFSSTSEIYGDPQITPQPEHYFGNVNPVGPRSCYNEAKRFGEALIQSYNKVHKSHHGIVRIFNTYGPRMNSEDKRVINSFAQALTQKNSFLVYGNGSQTRSFCYISDLIQGLLCYGESTITVPVNLGNDQEISIIDVINIFQSFTCEKIKIVFKQSLPDDPKQRRPDLSLARSHFPKWIPQVQLRQGIYEVINWHAGVSQNETLMISQNVPIR